MQMNHSYSISLVSSTIKLKGVCPQGVLLFYIMVGYYTSPKDAKASRRRRHSWNNWSRFSCPELVMR